MNIVNRIIITANDFTLSEDKQVNGIIKSGYTINPNKYQILTLDG